MDKYDKFECENYEEIRTHVNKHKSIYLYGKYGTGKTHYLKFIERKLPGYTILKLSAAIHQELIDEIRYNKSTGLVKKSIVTKMKECDWLLIDDLGNEKMTEFVHEALQVVIDHRYLNNKPTFITSNYSLKELYNTWVDKIGDVKAGQLVSRIKTFGAIELKGKNWR